MGATVNREQDPVTVYVPHPESWLCTTIDQGSGIVGADFEDGRVIIYYEGNRYCAANLGRYADRVMQADGRFHLDYPTVASEVVAADQLIPVGRWFRQARRLELEVSPSELRWWVNLDDPSELISGP